eukprot:403364563
MEQQNINQKQFLLREDYIPIHKQIIQQNGCELDKIIEYRHHFHKYPEGHLNEYNTQAKLIEILRGFGYEEQQISKCADTGLIVDVKGEGEEQISTQNSDSIKMIALRADMDGLKMEEHNKEIEYKSTTEYAHMCGHDGHMANLLAVAQILINNKHKIPINKQIRLLFQPAEEGPGGAKLMIQGGCLEGVDEIYGLHNRPMFKDGMIRVKKGAMMASSTTINIKVRGRGGDGSKPDLVDDVISASASIICQLHTIKSRMIDSKQNAVLSITQFKSGNSKYYLPDESIIQGTLRTFDQKILREIESKIQHICECTALMFGVSSECDFDEKYPPLINHDKEAQFIQQLASEYFGQHNVSSDGLPVSGSEDFAFYLHEKPGCFFQLITHDERFPDRALHQSNFDYNDDMIATGAYFFLRIIESRLDCKIIKE